MKFKKEDLITIVHDDHDEAKFEIVEEGDWVAEYKYECRDIVFKFEDKFYSLSVDRSGSYHTDWYYSYEDWLSEVECPEVEPVEVTKVEWKLKR